MSTDLRFDGRVAIVTGAGGGLGRSHALLLGKRGARVVVNDLGGSMHGGGSSNAPAQKVVDEIKAAGGEAVANHDSVEDGAKIVQAALDTWGRIDIVVNNAGILRDVSFQKLAEEDWDLVYRVHVLGSYRVTRAAWNAMRDAGYGRVVFTASAAGIYGNFGQANYSMAKLGLVGLSNTLAIEGRKRGVLVNTIAPIAGSRLTETVLPKELVDALRPEYVSPLVAYLCHEGCTETGGLFEVGGGYFAKLRWERTHGARLGMGASITPEAVARAWPEVTSWEGAEHPGDITSSMQPVLESLSSKKKKGGNEFIDVDLALGFEFPPLVTEYTERDLVLYALGVGAGADPLDQNDLRYVYEMHGDGFRTLPTYAVVPVINSILELAKQGKQAPGLNYGFDRILHGEQHTRVTRPLPGHQKLTHRSRIANIWDKGKHAVVVIETRSYDEAGQELAFNEITMVVRGAGGWGGDRGPSNDASAPPDRAPDAVVEQKIHADQALLYRLTGDWNPLHADPAFAQAFGFPRPILHGLCTYGFAARHVIQAFCANDARRFKSIRARFADSVFPGETLVTEMWKESPERIVLRSKVKERDKVAISNAVVELYAEIPAAPPAAKPAAPAPVPAPAAAAAVPAAPSGLTSADVFVAIRDYIEKNAELPGKVATVFQFHLKGPDASWVVDVKNGKGSVTSGTAAADVTLELADADFLAMTSGGADAQKLYFSGKLKITGNVMASQKLMFLKKVDPAAAMDAITRARGGGGGEKAATPAPAVAAPARTSRAPSIFKALAARLDATAGLAAEVGARLHFVVKDPESAWTVDLSAAPGKVIEGREGTAQTTITLAEEDLVALAAGAAAAALHQQGKLRVDGDVRPAHKLGFLKGLG